MSRLRRRRSSRDTRIWSPEDLFVASANVCLMTTFLAVAERAGLVFTSYESVAEGRLELVDGKFQFTTITLKPTITLPTNADAAKAKELIEKAEANCLISNSMKSSRAWKRLSGSREGRDRPVSPLCSRNARSRTPLLDARNGGLIRAIPRADVHERTWREHK